ILQARSAGGLGSGRSWRSVQTSRIAGFVLVVRDLPAADQETPVPEVLERDEQGPDAAGADLLDMVEVAGAQSRGVAAPAAMGGAVPRRTGDVPPAALEISAAQDNGPGVPRVIV